MTAPLWIRLRSPIVTLPNRLPITACGSTIVPAPMRTGPVITQNGPISASGAISASSEMTADGCTLTATPPRRARRPRARGTDVRRRCASLGAGFGIIVRYDVLSSGRFVSEQLGRPTDTGAARVGADEESAANDAGESHARLQARRASLSCRAG